MAEKKWQRQLHFGRGNRQFLFYSNQMICNVLNALLGKNSLYRIKICACYEVLIGHQTISPSDSYCNNLIKVRWVCGQNNKYSLLHLPHSQSCETNLLELLQRQKMSHGDRKLYKNPLNPLLTLLPIMDNTMDIGFGPL